jgi:hypothetical protein
MPKKVE